ASRWTLLRDEEGRPRSILMINTDITEKKKLETQFLRAQRMEGIGTLATGMAHDLNNILAPIMMAAPILRQETDPAERERFLDIVELSANRGADVIKQMLTFARGADGDYVLLQPIYLLEEISKIAARTFPKSIVLHTSYEENIRSLEADPTQRHQVLLNLCINARDAMPNGGELCLGAENFDVDEQYARMTPGATAGPHVMLQVTDNGSGIPKEVIDKIFDPFFTTKSIGHGTGLGLSTVAGIVRSHGGFIGVESEPGHTSFKIFLPAKAVLSTANALNVDALIPQGNGQTILLVDDEPSIREVAELILKRHGYKVLLSEDGPTALALFARHMGLIAVVITDLSMPGMDGLMLVRTLRRMRPGLKIIVSTGRTDEFNAAATAALNIDGTMSKPYTSPSLLLKISHVLHSGMQDAA
ncbi:MAG TPA: response regulator, partial [Chthoniobacterales bacterium]